MDRTASSRLALLALATLAACAAAPPPVSTRAAAPPPWNAFVEQFIEGYLAAHPSFAVAMGRHEYDGQLPDWSANGIAKDIASLERARTTALGFEPARLSADERFQRAYFLASVEGELFWLRDARQPFVNPAYYFGSGLDPNTYVSMPYAPADVRLRAFIRYARALPQALAQLRTNLAQPLPLPFVEYGMRGFKGFAEYFRTQAPAAFAQVEDAGLQAELREVLAPAAQGMEDLSTWLDSRKTDAGAGFALGPEGFASMLAQTSRVKTPLADLARIGEADLARNLAALTEACAAYLPHASIQACVDKQGADKPSGGAVEGAREQLEQLRSFVVSHAIVSIPDPREAKVEEAPPYNRQNFAYIDIPGPYEKNLPSVYYIAPPDPSWTQTERDAYVPGKADLLFTSVHEVWPGHFLQFLHANHGGWRFGQLFGDYAFTEGWAHYSEELMVEEGLAKDAPELHIGQILNALLRNVRFVCAIGLHTQGMSVAQCEQLFKDKAYQDAGNARQQAARGCYDPGYLNYTLGKLMLRKLRGDWQAENPGAALQQFHDAVLHSGMPPIPLLRSQLLKQDSGVLF
jgi:hypothetical protein